MAFLNNIYLFVVDEKVSRDVAISSHPVEKGLDITDNIKRSPLVINISGEIVGARTTLYIHALQNLMFSGSYVEYSGNNTIKNAVIESFDTDYTNAVTGGCTFSMKLREMRVAASAYIGKSSSKKPTQNGTQQVQSNTKNKYYIVKKGDTLWSIAKAYYGDESKFINIYRANSDKVKVTNALTPGIRLLMPQ